MASRVALCAFFEWPFVYEYFYVWGLLFLLDVCTLIALAGEAKYALISLQDKFLDC